MHPPAVHPRSFHRQGKRGFTLLELLVATAILLCLVMLAFSATKGIIERSQQTSCVNRLRSIGVALQAYCAENNGKLIPAAAIGDNYFWFDALNPYIGYAEYGRGYPYPDVTAEKSGFPLPWQQCPAQKAHMTQRQQVGYGWNHINFGYKAWSTAFGSNSSLSQVTQPSATIIIGDAKDAETLPGNDYQYRYIGLETAADTVKLARRHSGNGNYLMLDGHVESFPPEALPRTHPLWKRK